MFTFPFFHKKRRNGPTIGVFTPGSETGPNQALALLQDFSGTNFRFFFDRSLAKTSNFLLEKPLSWQELEADNYCLSPKEKAESFHRLSLNENVDVIWGFDGPEGTIETIKHIDWDLVQENPKVVIGFSDISAFLNAVTAKTGTPTIHAENLSSIAPKSRNFSVLAQMMKGKNFSLTSEFLNYTYSYPAIEADSQRFETENSDPPPPFVETLSVGRAKGKLVGGNLTRLCELHDVGIIPDYKEAILFLEDTGERIETIQTRIGSLERMGIFDAIKGLIIGDFNNISKGLLLHDNRLVELFNRLADTMERQNKPCITGFPTGHMRLKPAHLRRLFPLPIGVDACLKAERNASVLQLKPLPPEFRI